MKNSVDRLLTALISSVEQKLTLNIVDEEKNP